MRPEYLTSERIMRTEKKKKSAPFQLPGADTAYIVGDVGLDILGL